MPRGTLSRNATREKGTVTFSTVERKRRVRPPREVIFDGVFEARLVALACSQAPPGRKRWTLRLLAEKAVELGWVERVPMMTVQRTLKKGDYMQKSRNASINDGFWAF